MSFALVAYTIYCHNKKCDAPVWGGGGLLEPREQVRECGGRLAH
jgi:hypothetical protein